MWEEVKNNLYGWMSCEGMEAERIRRKVGARKEKSCFTHPANRSMTLLVVRAEAWKVIFKPEGSLLIGGETNGSFTSFSLPFCCTTSALVFFGLPCTS